MIVLIDNYDSFTYNLVHYLYELGKEVEVVRNDKTTSSEIIAKNPEAIILSPGPCTPDEAGICLDLVKECTGKIPVFGVCLGHQTIGQAFGGKIVRAPEPIHGKVDKIYNNGKGVFKDLPNEFEVTRYHSLIIDKESLPDCLEITAENKNGIIMAIRHKKYDIQGVQFHPESIASQYGHDILRNFLGTSNK